jgi:hypothetical protein
MTRTAGDRRGRIAAVCWLVIAVVIGNGMYDLLLTRSVKEYLLRVAMYEAGRGPLVTLAPFMDVSIYDAIWKSTLAASLLLLAALLTIRYLGRTP